MSARLQRWPLLNGRVGPVYFMGWHARKWWFDVRTPHGWLVVQAGWFKHPKLPRIYWSPNGTPWHHRARNVFRARYVYREECVCRELDCTQPVALPKRQRRTA